MAWCASCLRLLRTAPDQSLGSFGVATGPLCLASLPMSRLPCFCLLRLGRWLGLCNLCVSFLCLLNLAVLIGYYCPHVFCPIVHFDLLLISHVWDFLVAGVFSPLRQYYTISASMSSPRVWDHISHTWELVATRVPTARTVSEIASPDSVPAHLILGGPGWPQPARGSPAGGGHKETP